MAEAAMGRYAVTVYVNTALKQKRTPAANGAEAIMGTIQCTLGYVVKASQ